MTILTNLINSCCSGILFRSKVSPAADESDVSSAGADVVADEGEVANAFLGFGDEDAFALPVEADVDVEVVADFI